MILTDLWRAGSRPTISFEFYPARDDKAQATLDKTLGELLPLRPDFVSVTFGAGGSTRDGSRRLVERLLGQQHNVLAYFAGVGLGPADIRAVLDDYRSLGVHNVLAVRGDAPTDDADFRPHPESFAHASELIAFVAPRYPFCLGAAGYPEGHQEAASKERDLEFLKLKVANGARFVITQYFYDNRCYLGFVERCRGAGIQVPIVPGVMPVFSVKMMENLAKLCGATITDELRRGLAALPADDKEAVGRFGIEFALAQCRGLLEAGAPGLHFYTLDRAKATRTIVDRLRAEKLV